MDPRAGWVSAPPKGPPLPPGRPTSGLQEVKVRTDQGTMRTDQRASLCWLAAQAPTAGPDRPKLHQVSLEGGRTQAPSPVSIVSFGAEKYLILMKSSLSIFL